MTPAPASPTSTEDRFQLRLLRPEAHALSATDAKVPRGSGRKGQRQAVLVLGMHRSGTSVVTEGLSLLGGRLPVTLLAPQPDNPRGFFEPAEVVVAHDRILASAGSSWADWNPFPASWYESLEAQDYLDDLMDIARAEYGKTRVFLVKDPRLCRFVPLWRKALARLKVDPVAVLPFRNPLEVAASLRLRNGFSAAHSKLLWLRHLLDAEHATRDFPRTFIAFDALIGDARREIERLEKQLPVKWPRKSPRAYYELDKAIETERWHHVAPADELFSRTDVVGWVKEAYREYKVLSRDPSNRDAMRVLDNIRCEFDKACEAFSFVFEAERMRTEEQANKVARLREELIASEGIENERQLLAENTSSLHSERDGLATKLVSARSRIADLEIAVSEEASRAGAAEAGLSRLPSLEEELESGTAKIIALEQELVTLESQLRASAEASALKDQETKAQLAQVNAALQAQSAELSTRAAEVDPLKAAAASYTKSLAEISERNDTLERAIAERAEKVRRSQPSFTTMCLRYLYWTFSFRVFRQHRHEQRVNKRMQLASASGLYDGQWYLHTYPDVALTSFHPLRHYGERGWQEERRPGPSADQQSAAALACRMAEI